MFPANTAEAEPPLAVRLHVRERVRERTDSKKNERTEFWLSVSVVSEWFYCVVIRLCSLINHGKQGWDASPTKEWRRLKNLSHSSLSGLSHLYGFGTCSLFAPGPCVLVTRSDWPASIRIAVHYL